MTYLKTRSLLLVMIGLLVLVNAQAQFYDEFVNYTKVENVNNATSTLKWLTTVHAQDSLDFNGDNQIESWENELKLSEVLAIDGNERLHLLLNKVADSIFLQHKNTSSIRNHFNRNEVATQQNGSVFEPHEGRSFSWTVHLGNDYELDTAGNKDLLAQMQYVNNPDASYPPLSIQVVNDRWKLVIVNDDTLAHAVTKDFGQVQLATDYEWSLTYVLSDSTNGMIEARLKSENGQLHVFDTIMVTAVHSLNYFFKLGIYKPGWWDGTATSHRKSIYFDSLWVNDRPITKGLMPLGKNCFNFKKNQYELKTMPVNASYTSISYRISGNLSGGKSLIFLSSGQDQVLDLRPYKDFIKTNEPYTYLLRLNGNSNPYLRKWSKVGCTFAIDSTLSTRLREEDCGASLDTHATIYLDDQVLKAHDQVKWYISEKGNSSNHQYATTNTPSIYLDQIDLLQPGKTYVVNARIENDSTSTWYEKYAGNPCEIHIVSSASARSSTVPTDEPIAEGSEQTFQTIYPMPASSYILMSIPVENVEIIGLDGSTYPHTLAGDGHSISFDLAPGIYFMTYSVNGRTEKAKLLIE